MKGIILAGGKGSRLYPLSLAAPKALVACGRLPAIYYQLASLKEAGIKDVLVVVGRHQFEAYDNCIGSGRAFGLNVFFRVQEEALGISHSLYHAEGFLAPSEKCVVLLGDNILGFSIRETVQRFQDDHQAACHVYLQKLGAEEARVSGVASMRGGNIVEIVEKPSVERLPSLAIDPGKAEFLVSMGIYMFSEDLFERVRHLRPSQRNEYEITDLLNWYIGHRSLKFSVTPAAACILDSGSLAGIGGVQQDIESLGLTPRTVEILKSPGGAFQFELERGKLKAKIFKNMQLQ